MPNLPLLIPVLVGGVLLAVLAYRPLSRWLPSPAWSSALLIVSLAIVAAITLTPQDLDQADASRWWLIAWLLETVGDRGLNVLLFVPLGVAVMFIGRPRLRIAAMVGAIALPWVVEGTQHLVAPLARDSQWQDVIDNTAGVLIGLGIGWVAQRWWARRAEVSRREPTA